MALPHDIFHVQDGVYQVGEHFQAARCQSVVWVLVDTDASLSGVPEVVLVTKNSPFFVICLVSC